MKRALGLGLVVLALTAPTAAGWQRQQLSARAFGIDDGVALAGNSRGDGAVIYQQNERLQIAIARRGRAFGKPRPVPGSKDATGTRIAMDELGNVLITWTYLDNTQPAGPNPDDEPCCYGTRVTVRSPSGRFQRVQTLAPRGTSSALQSYAIAGGRVAVAYVDVAGLKLRFAAPAHRLGAFVRVSGGGPALGVAPLRNGPVVTALVSRRSDAVIREVAVHGRHAGAPRVVAAGLPLGASIGIATDWDGNQAMAWSPPYGSRPQPVYAAARKRGGRFHARRISSDGPTLALHVALAPSGAAVAAWNTTDGHIVAASRRAGHDFTAARALVDTRAGGFVDDLTLGIDGAGRSVFGWRQQLAGNAPHGFGAFRSAPGGRLGMKDFGLASGFGDQGTAVLDGHGLARLAWRVGGVVNVARARFPRTRRGG